MTRSQRRPIGPGDYHGIASAMAWVHLFTPEPRRLRFVPPTAHRRGLMLLVDGEPRPARERVWRRVISSAQEHGYEVAAQASAPTGSGKADDGATEVVAIFCDDSGEEALFMELWADAVIAEEGK